MEKIPNDLSNNITYNIEIDNDEVSAYRQTHNFQFKDGNLVIDENIEEDDIEAILEIIKSEKVDNIYVCSRKLLEKLNLVTNCPNVLITLKHQNRVVLKRCSVDKANAIFEELDAILESAKKDAINEENKAVIKAEISKCEQVRKLNLTDKQIENLIMVASIYYKLTKLIQYDYFVGTLKTLYTYKEEFDNPEYKDELIYMIEYYIFDENVQKEFYEAMKDYKKYNMLMEKYDYRDWVASTIECILPPFKGVCSGCSALLGELFKEAGLDFEYDVSISRHIFIKYMISDKVFIGLDLASDCGHSNWNCFASKQLSDKDRIVFSRSFIDKLYSIVGREKESMKPKNIIPIISE